MGLLAIDAGNTRLKWAYFASSDAPVPGTAADAQGAVFLEQLETLADAEWSRLGPPTAMIGCIVAGDVARRRVEAQLEQLDGWDLVPRWVLPAGSGGGVVNGYDQPTRLGADRFIAHVGAWQRVRARGPAQPVLVVMIGTAVTIDAIDGGGRFLGGLILPGYGIMLTALQRGTAGLHVPTGEVRDFPCNTSDALTSGGTFAITGAIERQCRRLAAVTGLTPQVLVTGGAGWKVSPHLDVPHELVESLLFDGLLTMQQERLEAARVVVR